MHQKITLLARSAWLVMLLLFVPSLVMAEKHPWVKYDTTTCTLTFCYGEEKPTATDSLKVYDLPTYEDEDNSTPKWYTEHGSSIKKVVFSSDFSEYRPTCTRKWFYFLTNLTEIEGLKNLNTSEVTNMSEMFCHCQTLKSLDVTGFDTKNVTNMADMFSHCEALTSLDLSNFDTSRLIGMQNMFYYCSNITTLDLTSFNNANVTNADYLFAYCKALATINVSEDFLFSSSCSGSYMFSDTPCLPAASAGIASAKDESVGGKLHVTVASVKPWVAYYEDSKSLVFHYDDRKCFTLATKYYEMPAAKQLPGWNGLNVKTVTVNKEFVDAPVTSLYKWFYLMSDIKSVEGIEYINTEKVTDMSYMFHDCSSLTSLDLTKFNTGQVTDMSNMFLNCSSLASLDLTKFNTDSVTNMSGMFSGCGKLTAALDLTSFNTMRVMDMSDMFLGCSSLTTLDLSKFNTANVTNMTKMFYGCSSLSHIYVTNNFKTDKVTSSDDMNKGCVNLPHYQTDGPFDKTYAFNASVSYGWLDNVDATTAPWVEFQKSTGILTFHNNGLKPVTKATACYDLPTDETSAQPGWMEYSSYVTKVVVDADFRYINPTTLSCWFKDMANLKDFEGFEYISTYKAKNMSSMFYGCTGLTSLDLKSFNTESVTDMSCMFYRCTGLTSLDVSSFNTGRVVSMERMFTFCEALTNIDVKNFNTQNVTDMYEMFAFCYRLDSLDLTSFNNAKVTTTKEMFTNDAALKKIKVSDKFLLTSSCDGTETFYGCTSLPGFNAVSCGSDKVADVSVGGYLNVVEASVLPWALLDGYTLTFHYDNQKYFTKGTIYDISTTGGDQGWLDYNTQVHTVVINKELADLPFASLNKLFYNLTTLSTIEGLEYLNTTSTTDMSQMFQNCTSLSSLDLSCLSSDNVVTMESMFDNCTRLTSLVLFNLNTSKVTNMSYMFNLCSNLATIYVDSNFSTASVTSSEKMFIGCSGLDNFDSGKYDATMAKDISEGGYLSLSVLKPWAEYYNDTYTLTFHYDKYKLTSTATETYDVTGDSTTSPEWIGCRTAVQKVVFLENFKDARPTTCYKWFDNMKSLTSVIGLEYLNTEKVTNMGYMFNECALLTSLDLTGLNFASVVNADYMFSSCSKLASVYVDENFDFTKVTSSNNMFSSCSSLPNYNFMKNENKFDKTYAHYKPVGSFTLRKQFSVGDAKYNIDGYTDNDKFVATCYDNVKFTDGDAFKSPDDFTFADEKTVSYERSVSNEWATLCLPFEYSVTENASYKFYDFAGIEGDILTITPITSGTIAAGTSVIVNAGDNSTIRIKATSAKTVSQPVYDSSKSTRLKGYFEPEIITAVNDYFIANNKFYRASDYSANGKGVRINPYRAYIFVNITGDAKYAPVLNIEVDGETTSVNSVFDSLDDASEYYDASGRRLDNLQKGFNIVKRGNKTIKVIIK